MIVSAVLLFDEVDAQLLVEGSAQVNRQIDGEIALSARYLPHVTLAQFEVDSASEAELLAKEVQVLKYPDSITANKVVEWPSTERNQLWVELGFNKSEELMRLHNDVLATSFARSHKLFSAARDDFRPHCTLSLLNNSSSAKLPTFSNLDSIQEKEFQNIKLAVGGNGENYTFVSKVWCS